MMPGGVCAVLDYEVDMMAEYVSEMAMRVVIPNASVQTPFRKFVSQVLTSTRLPSTTILLGMNYLAKRVNMLNAVGAFHPTEGQVWRMLTCGLLLGSKFLDDNTFQNRSWSEVSGIAVHELNSMENEWLRHIDWSLFVNLDKSGDYNAWLKSWKDWQEAKQREQIAQRERSQAAARERLAPLVTSMRGNTRPLHHPLAYEGWTPEEITEHERMRFAPSAKSYTPRESSWQTSYQTSWPSAPLTPPDSGYGTPEYMNSAASVNTHYNEWFNAAVSTGYGGRGYQSAGALSHAHPSSQSHFGSRPNQYQQPFYSYGGPSVWETNVAECNCPQCLATLHKGPHYTHAHPYGQTVMG